MPLKKNEYLSLNELRTRKNIPRGNARRWKRRKPCFRAGKWRRMPSLRTCMFIWNANYMYSIFRVVDFNSLTFDYYRSTPICALWEAIVWTIVQIDNREFRAIMSRKNFRGSARLTCAFFIRDQDFHGPIWDRAELYLLFAPLRADFPVLRSAVVTIFYAFQVRFVKKIKGTEKSGWK